jgi:hypothetical protein
MGAFRILLQPRSIVSQFQRAIVFSNLHRQVSTLLCQKLQRHWQSVLPLYCQRKDSEVVTLLAILLSRKV